MKPKKATALCMALFLFAGAGFAGTQITVHAEESYSFDAVYYAQSNPDVVSKLGSEPEALYQHYVSFGRLEGRSAFNGDPGLTPEQIEIESAERAAKEAEEAALKEKLEAEAREKAAKKKAENDSAPINVTDTRESAVSGEELASFTLALYPSKASNTNARRACDILDGYVVQPGTEFSFNTAVGRRTTAGGFVEAEIFSNGKHARGIGGGICKISSAIYNLCLLTDMQVTERHAHSLGVSYVARGYDATVSYGTADLRFINTYDFPITISTAYDADGFHLKFLVIQ